MALSWWAVLLLVALVVVVLVVALQISTILTMPKPLALKGKHVMIVGGSSGIGLAMAKLAAAEHAHITLVARDKAKLADAKAQVERYISKGPLQQKIITVSADVSNPAEARAAVETAQQECGPIQALVLSQGTAKPGVFEETPLETMQTVMNTNVWGGVNILKAALPGMKSQTGPRRIAFLSSQGGQVGVFGMAHYCASKFALRGLAESLQQELLMDGILVSLIFPPDTDTPALAEEQLISHEVTKRISATSKLAQPGDVALRGWRGVKAGQFSVPCNFDGFMLGLVTAGMSPQPSLIVAATEIFLMGFMRIVALIILRDFHSIIRTWHREQGREGRSSSKLD